MHSRLYTNFLDLCVGCSSSSSDTSSDSEVERRQAKKNHKGNNGKQSKDVRQLLEALAAVEKSKKKKKKKRELEEVQPKKVWLLNLADFTPPSKQPLPVEKHWTSEKFLETVTKTVSFISGGKFMNSQDFVVKYFNPIAELTL